MHDKTIVLHASCLKSQISLEKHKYLLIKWHAYILNIICFPISPLACFLIQLSHKSGIIYNWWTGFCFTVVYLDRVSYNTVVSPLHPSGRPEDTRDLPSPHTHTDGVWRSRLRRSCENRTTTGTRGKGHLQETEVNRETLKTCIHNASCDCLYYKTQIIKNASQ